MTVIAWRLFQLAVVNVKVLGLPCLHLHIATHYRHGDVACRGACKLNMKHHGAAIFIGYRDSMLSQLPACRSHRHTLTIPTSTTVTEMVLVTVPGTVRISGDGHICRAFGNAFNGHYPIVLAGGGDGGVRGCCGISYGAVVAGTIS